MKAGFFFSHKGDSQFERDTRHEIRSVPGHRRVSATQAGPRTSNAFWRGTPRAISPTLSRTISPVAVLKPEMITRPTKP